MTGIWLYISAGLAIVLALFIAGIAIAVLLALFNGTIRLDHLIAEPADPRSQAKAQGRGEDDASPPETPKASMSRLQLLIFTFVIGGVYLVLCLESGSFVPIPDNVLLLLGISGGTYAASKTIRAADNGKQADADVAKAKADADAARAAAAKAEAMAGKVTTRTKQP